jgi:hypothetical protein
LEDRRLSSFIPADCINNLLAQKARFQPSSEAGRELGKDFSEGGGHFRRWPDAH